MPIPPWAMSLPTTYFSSSTCPGCRVALEVIAVRAGLGGLGFRGAGRLGGRLGGAFDAHAVERTPHEHERRHEEGAREHEAVLLRHLERELDRQQAEQRGELDDR